MSTDKYETAKYSGDYSDSGLMDKVKNSVKFAGLGLVYKALQLFYVAKNPNVPMKLRALIIAPLGYFISPIDLIPDITPIVGFGDDATVLAGVYVMAQAYITDDIKQQAKNTLRQFFGESIINELD